MKILEINISKKTESVILEMTSTFSETIEYHNIDEISKQIGYRPLGAVQPTPIENKYSLWLATDLPPEIFETNLLHELRHIVQARNGFPMIYNKIGNSHFAADETFFKEVGTSIQSSVLDLEVISWLHSLGYSSECFTYTDNIDPVRLLSQVSEASLTDKYNLSNATLILYTAHMRAEQSEQARCIDMFSSFPTILEHFNKLVSLVNFDTVGTPENALMSMGHIIDLFDLWSMYYISTEFQTIKIKTKKQFASFASQHS